MSWLDRITGREAELLREQVAEQERRIVSQEQRLIESISLAELYAGDPAYQPGEPALYQESGQDYRDGDYRPLFEDEERLASIRGACRYAWNMDTLTQNVLTTLQGYALGVTGFQYIVEHDEEGDEELAAELQEVIDELLVRSKWVGDLHDELFLRQRYQGERIVHVQHTGGGYSRLRVLEPSWVTGIVEDRNAIRSLLSGSGVTLEEVSTKYGVVTDRFNTAEPLGYIVMPYGDPSQIEYLPAEDVALSKVNTPRLVKRGLPDNHSADHWAKLVGNVMGNMLSTTSNEAAIQLVRKHIASTTPTQVQGLGGSTVSRYTDAKTGREVRTQTFNPRTILDTKNVDYDWGPTGTHRNQAYLDASAGGSRRFGMRWNAPDHVTNANAGDTTHAGTLAAESPFTRAVMRLQSLTGRADQELLWIAVRHALENGRIGKGAGDIDELKERVKITYEPPDVATKDRQVDHSIRQGEHQAGWLSAQTWCEETGRDWEQEKQRREEEDAEAQEKAEEQMAREMAFAQQAEGDDDGGGDGDGPKTPTDGLPGSAIARGDKKAVSESEDRVRRELFSLIEHYGPGPHENGSPQSVHGSKGGSENGPLGKAASTLKDALRDGNGLTVQPVSNHVPVKGYAVSRFPEAELSLPIDDLSVDAVYDWLVENQDRFDDPEIHAGIWHDEKHGVVYLDLSVVVDSAEEADAISREFNQEAYYDLAGGIEVFTKDPEKRRKSASSVSEAQEQEQGRSKENGREPGRRDQTQPGVGLLEKSNCGANAPGGGGFQKGNSCASGSTEYSRGGLSGALRRVADTHGFGAPWARSRGYAKTPSPEVVAAVAREQQAATGPIDPATAESYRVFKERLGEQYEAVLDSGLEVFEWQGEGEPYKASDDKPWSPSSKRMREVVSETGAFHFFMTEKGFGSEGAGAGDSPHPLLELSPYATSDGKPMLWNDVFRVVHDGVAHLDGGFSFSTRGEYNGMMTHASQLPRESWPALFAETFAQNAVYETTGKFAEQNTYTSEHAGMIGEFLEGAVKESVNESEGELTEYGDSDYPIGAGRLRRRPSAYRGLTEAELMEVAGCGANAPGGGGFQPGNSCAGGSKGVFSKGRSKKTGDYAIDDDLPLEPGTAPIPDGHIRFFHYSNINDQPPEGVTWDEHVHNRAVSLRNGGIRMGSARGEGFGEPNQIWASRKAPDNIDRKIFVEFSLPHDDQRIGGTIRRKEGSVDEIQNAYSDATFTGDIGASDIVAVHEPWHFRARYLMDEKGLEMAGSGEFDHLLDRIDDDSINDYAAAVRRAKDVYARGLTEAELMERAGCGANAPGGGGFQKGNNCATGRGPGGEGGKGRDLGGSVRGDKFNQGKPLPRSKEAYSDEELANLPDHRTDFGRDPNANRVSRRELPQPEVDLDEGLENDPLLVGEVRDRLGIARGLKAEIEELEKEQDRLFTARLDAIGNDGLYSELDQQFRENVDTVRRKNGELQEHLTSAKKSLRMLAVKHVEEHSTGYAGAEGLEGSAFEQYTQLTQAERRVGGIRIAATKAYTDLKSKEDKTSEEMLKMGYYKQLFANANAEETKLFYAKERIARTEVDQMRLAFDDGARGEDAARIGMREYYEDRVAMANRRVFKLRANTELSRYEFRRQLDEAQLELGRFEEDLARYNKSNATPEPFFDKTAPSEVKVMRGGFGRDEEPDLGAVVESMGLPPQYSDPNEFARLGGLHDSEYPVYADILQVGSGSAQIDLTNNYQASRTLTTDFEGNPVIRNNELEVADGFQKQGIGLEVFARQVQAAKDAGFSKITCSAHRSYRYNGYYSWPRMGYDGPLPNSVVEEASEWSYSNHGVDVDTVQEVMQLPGGVDWWRENGDTFEATFDLQEGSPHLTRLELYLAAKGSGKMAVRESVDTPHERRPMRPREEWAEELEPFSEEEEAIHRRVDEQMREYLLWRAMKLKGASGDDAQS